MLAIAWHTFLALVLLFDVSLGAEIATDSACYQLPGNSFGI
jgi:hypothetical protein